MLSSSVWLRDGNSTLPRSVFYLFLGLILAYGFALTWYISEKTLVWEPGLTLLLLVGLGLPVLGCLLSLFSENSLFSFIGFTMVVGGFAVLVGPLLTLFSISDPGTFKQTIIFTACIVATMMLSAALFPRVYDSLGGALLSILSVIVLISFARPFVPAIQSVGIIDYISAGLFALYVGYDTHRAYHIPATLDNALDVAVSLYLDVVNLFLELFRIIASKN